MLRILVISLFVANLLLLGFQRSKPVARSETVARQTVEEDASIPTIHLFSEMIQDQDLMSDNRQCFSLGPFHSDEDKEEIRTRLLEVSTSINERQTQALVEKGYWVFMPPYTSLLEANQALLSLQALGLEDIGIIYDGQWQYAISLGYFLRQENAQRRKKGLEERGYAPLIRVQRKAEPRYWLDYEQNPGSGLVALDMQNRPNDFMQRSLPCPEQDLFDINPGDSAEAVGELGQMQADEGNAESSSDQGIGTKVENNVEELTENNTQTVSGEANEITPANNIEPMPGENEETVPGQSTEIEPETGSEAEIDGV